MTTTAGKIKELTINLASLRQQVDELDMQLQELCFSPDSPDPEPLERWITTYPLDQFTSDNAHRSAELAGKHAIPGKALRIAVHMREVTPQDERDRKDAARYREAKLRQFSLHGSMRYKWDEIIDKAMETGD